MGFESCSLVRCREGAGLDMGGEGMRLGELANERVNDELKKECLPSPLRTHFGCFLLDDDELS